MLYQIINPMISPPGGWYYETEEDPYVRLEGFSLISLMRNIQAHYQVQDMKAPQDLDQRVIHQICSGTTGGYCREISEGAGDTVHKVLKKTGIDKIYRRTVKSKGICLGCSKRQKALNSRIPYKKVMI